MYCSACASPVTAGLKFCNRCGANLRKDEEATSSNLGAGLIWGVVMVTLFGLGIMFGGAIALKNGGGFDSETIGLFMTFCFLTIGTAEVFLLRQLSRVLAAPYRNQRLENTAPLFQPATSAPGRELRAVRDTAEPIASVTENTTRTLEHSFRDIRGS